MGFALWIDGDLAWAQGTHEYRPMGVAVVGTAGTFTSRDFRARRRVPFRDPARFAGFFASIGHLNQHLEERGRVRLSTKNRVEALKRQGRWKPIDP